MRPDSTPAASAPSESTPAAAPKKPRDAVASPEPPPKPPETASGVVQAPPAVESVAPGTGDPAAAPRSSAAAGWPQRGSQGARIPDESSGKKMSRKPAPSVPVAESEPDDAGPGPEESDADPVDPRDPEGGPLPTTVAQAPTVTAAVAENLGEMAASDTGECQGFRVRVSAVVSGRADAVALFYRRPQGMASGNLVMFPDMADEITWAAETELTPGDYEFTVAVTGPDGPTTGSAGTLSLVCPDRNDRS